MSRSSPTGKPGVPATARRDSQPRKSSRSAVRLAVLVIYDIAHDGTRAKVADCCLDYGLDRVQYSAFVGELSRTHQEELLMKIKRKVGKQAAKVQLVTVAADDWQRRLIFEQGSPNKAGVEVDAQAGEEAGATRS
jgi:CRISPR-associated protein Cas2